MADKKGIVLPAQEYKEDYSDPPRVDEGASKSKPSLLAKLKASGGGGTTDKKTSDSEPTSPKKASSKLSSSDDEIKEKDVVKGKKQGDDSKKKAAKKAGEEDSPSPRSPEEGSGKKKKGSSKKGSMRDRFKRKSLSNIAIQGPVISADDLIRLNLSTGEASSETVKEKGVVEESDPLRKVERKLSGGPSVDHSVQVPKSTQVKVKMEGDRKTIQVGGTMRSQHERPYFGVPLTELMARDNRPPRIVTDCIQWLWQHGRDFPQFCGAEWKGDRIDNLISRVEGGQYQTLYDEKDMEPALVVGVLKRFFHDLPGGLFQPTSLVEQLSSLLQTAGTAGYQTGEVIHQHAPAPHVAVMRTLFGLLYDLVSAGKLSAPSIADAFEALLFREGDGKSIIEFLLQHWPSIGQYLELRSRRTVDQIEEGTSLKDWKSLMLALTHTGLARHFEMLKLLDIDLSDLRSDSSLTDLELTTLGISPSEVASLHDAADAMVKKVNKPEPAEQVWEGDGLDPKIANLLTKIGLGHLGMVFMQFRVDWTILDMSSAADLRELGLDESSIEKIIAALGKQVAEPLRDKPIDVSADGSLRLQATHLGDTDTVLDPKWLVDLRDVRVQKKIGLGGYAEVWQAQWKGKTVAFKLLQEETMDDQRVVDEFRREMVVLSKLEHPNIVAFHGCVDKGRSLAMILEYAAKGDLENMLADRGIPIQYSQRLRWAKQVAQGLQYLHTRSPRVIHRDIKSANVLVDELLCTKICDFGLAKRHVLATNEEILGSVGTLKNVLNVRSVAVQFTTLVGTPAWTAPELIANRSYSEKVDIYSYGVFLWELMCRQIPHEGMPHFDLAYAILSRNLRPPIPDWMPQTFSQLMQSCWAPKPEFHPPIDVVLKIITTMLAQPRHEEVKLPY